MKFTELQPNEQVFILVLSNKSEYVISGETKNAIMKSTSQFVELGRGDIINKSFITEIRADISQTKSKLQNQKLLENP